MTEEAPFRLVPRDEYAAKKAELTGRRLEQVEAAERRIATAPDDGEDRWPSTDRGWIDYSASDSGSWIEYKRDERPDHSFEIDLIDLIDVTIASSGRRWPVDSG